MRSVVFPAVAGWVGLVIFAVFLTVGFAGIARAESHDLEHQLSDRRARGAKAGAREQVLARDAAAQSEQIDVVESQIGALQNEVAALEQQLA